MGANMHPHDSGPLSRELDIPGFIDQGGSYYSGRLLLKQHLNLLLPVWGYLSRLYARVLGSSLDTKKME